MNWDLFMPDEDKNFRGSFVLDFVIWWRQSLLYMNILSVKQHLLIINFHHRMGGKNEIF